MHDNSGHPSRARRVVGIIGILIGLVGLLNILAERRAAKERERVLATLAEDFRKRDQQRDGAVVWEGRSFRPGDRVRIRKWAGTMKPSETGAAVEVQAAQGQVGVVLRGEKRKSTEYLRFDPDEPVQIVRVRWLPQRWKESGGSRWLDLPEFQATIHVSHLERIE